MQEPNDTPDVDEASVIQIRDAGPAMPDPQEYGRLGTFAELLSYLGKDWAAIEEVKRVVQAVKDNGGKGKVVVTIGITDHDPAMLWTAEVAATVPKPKSTGKLLYADGKGFPALRDPYEPQLPLGRVKNHD